MSWTRLQIRFDSLLCTDVKEINDEVSRTYPLSYSGKYIHGDRTCVYMQTSSSSVRMTPNKLKKILQKYGSIEFIGPFRDMEGMLDQDIGQIRTKSRKTIPRNISSQDNNSTNTITGDHNTISANNSITDNSVTINLTINAFGEEDVSHITMEQLDDWIGKKEDIVESVKDKLGAYLTNALKKIVYDKKYEERMGEWEASSEEKRGETSRPEYNGDEALTDEEVDISVDKRIARNYASEMKKIIMSDFARVLYHNPHNANVHVDRKGGCFRVFNGEKWDSHGMSELCEKVLENLRDKSRETVDGLDLLDTNFVKMFTEYLDCIWKDKGTEEEEKVSTRTAKRHLSNLMESCVNNEIAAVKEKTRKKVRLVGCSATGTDIPGDKDVSTWEDLRNA